MHHLLALAQDINWLAVIVAGLVCFMLAALWYCSWFARPWRRAHGISMTTDESSKPQHRVSFLLIFLGYFAMATVIALLLAALQINSLGEGARLGLLLGIGLSMADALVENQLQGKPAMGFFLDAGFRSAAFSAMGALIAAWQ